MNIRLWRCISAHLIIWSLISTMATLIIVMRYKAARQPETFLLKIDKSSRFSDVKPSYSRSQLTASGVPKILHFVSRDGKIVQAYKRALDTCAHYNPDWDIVMWTDATIKEFVHIYYPGWVYVFESFPSDLQRSDAIRYLILHKFGGVYMTLDMVCQRPMLPALSPYSCFLERERQHQTRFLHNKRYLAMNSAMGCIPDHPFFWKVCKFVFHQDRLKKPYSSSITIFETTGPFMLTNLYQQWSTKRSRPPVTLLSESYFSPRLVPSINNRCRNIFADEKKAEEDDIPRKKKICLEIKKLGYEKSDNYFITNSTVALHYFPPLGEEEQTSSIFDVTNEFPRVKSYYQLLSMTNQPMI